MADYTPPSGPNYGSPGSNAGPGPQASVPPRDRPELDTVPRDVAGKKIAAGVLGILLGSLGIHKFILGYTGTGIVMLLLSVLSCGGISAIIGIIEGIVYLTKTDEEFYRTYIVGHRNWF